MPGVDAGYFRHWFNFRPVPVALISARFLCRAYIRKLNYEDDKGYCDDRAVRNGWPTEGLKSYFQPGPLTMVVIIANLRYVASRIWTWLLMVFFSNTKSASKHLSVRLFYFISLLLLYFQFWQCGCQVIFPIFFKCFFISCLGMTFWFVLPLLSDRIKFQPSTYHFYWFLSNTWNVLIRLNAWVSLK